MKSSTNKQKLNVEMKNASNIDFVIVRANELRTQREEFETTILARSNEALYGILRDVYALFHKAFKDECIKEVLTKMQEELLARNIRVQQNSPALTVFVRFVFNSDRKRAYNYSSTLMAAAQAGIEPDGLAAFITSKNGVEECKREFKKKDETRKKEEAIKQESIEVERMLTSMPPVHTVKFPKSSVTLAEGAQYAFVIARIGANNSLELLHSIPRTTVGMQNTAIKELAKQLIDRKAAAAKDEKVQKSKAATKQAISSMRAVSSMTVAQLQAS